MGYYLWFSSMYYQCLAYFPATYNAFYTRTKSNTRLLLKIIGALLALNMIIIVGGWFGWRDAPRYRDNFEAARDWNIGILSFYLFAPFWGLYFVIGVATAFLYDACRPNETHSAWIWGHIADGCSLLMFAFVLAQLLQGNPNREVRPDLFELYMRPDEADQLTDTSAVNRIWSNSYARLFAPVTTLWVFALSTGRGHTARFFRQPFISVTLAPNSYNCFLFHQQVAQWYFALTRAGRPVGGGVWWNWWNFRKNHYWFSPEACPTEWYEYFYVVGLVVGWSRLMTDHVEPAVSGAFAYFWALLATGKTEDASADADADQDDTLDVLMGILEGMTGIEPEPDYTLEECGLASIGMPTLVTLLNRHFSTKGREVSIDATDLVEADTIEDIVEVVTAAKELADDKGV